MQHSPPGAFFFCLKHTMRVFATCALAGRVTYNSPDVMAVQANESVAPVVSAEAIAAAVAAERAEQEAKLRRPTKSMRV